LIDQLINNLLHRVTSRLKFNLKNIKIYSLTMITAAVQKSFKRLFVRLFVWQPSWAGFLIDLNFQDVMTSKLKNLDVSVQNLEVMQ